MSDEFLGIYIDGSIRSSLKLQKSYRKMQSEQHELAEVACQLGKAMLILSEEVKTCLEISREFHVITKLISNKSS